MTKYSLIYVVGVFVASMAQIVLKKSAKKEHTNLIKEYLNLNVILGYGMLFGSTFITIYAPDNRSSKKTSSFVSCSGIKNKKQNTKKTILIAIATHSFSLLFMFSLKFILFSRCYLCLIR